MNIWLIKDGEYLPIQSGTRKMRTWMLAEALWEQGHSVTWWASTFSHQLKKLMAAENSDTVIKPRFVLKTLYAGEYKKNVSLARLAHHHSLASKFRISAEQMPRPDIIVCSYPIIEVAYQATLFAEKNRIPLIVDIRDQWPSTYLHVCPKLFKPLVWLLVRHSLFKANRIFRTADRIVAMSEGCLNWGLDIAGRKAEPGHRVFHLGYDQTGSSETPNKDAGLSETMRMLRRQADGKVLFTFVGSFGQSYELPLLMDAAEKFEKAGIRQIHFVIAGNGEQFEVLSRRSKSLENVTLPGWLDSVDVSRLLSWSEVGLLPIYTFGEGTFPNKLFEYCASGLPVLSSIEGEMAELIAHHDLGYTYRCGDVQSFYNNALKLLLDEPLRRRFGKNAKFLFDNQFNADTIYHAFASYVEAVAKDKGD